MKTFQLQITQTWHPKVLQTDGQIDGWTDGWKDRQMDGLMDGWKDGRTEWTHY